MRLRWLLGLVVSLHSCSVMRGEDHFLTIGGGESPTNSEVSLEKNILYLQRFLSASGPASMPKDIYFANATEMGRDIRSVDPTPTRRGANQSLAQCTDQ